MTFQTTSSLAKFQQKRMGVSVRLFSVRMYVYCVSKRRKQKIHINCIKLFLWYFNRRPLHIIIKFDYRIFGDHD